MDNHLDRGKTLLTFERHPRILFPNTQQNHEPSRNTVLLAQAGKQADKSENRQGDP